MMIKRAKLFAAILLFGVSLFALSPLAVSAEETPQNEIDRSCRDNVLGIPTWYKYLPKDESDGRCSPQVSDLEAALPIGIAVLEAMLRIAGLVAVVMIMVGAFRYITSQGNPENASAARKTAINAIVGLVIVIIATSFVSFLGNYLIDSASGEEESSQLQKLQEWKRHV